jgi:CDP-4-dehydro-6-deoxyglucose reductase
LVLENGEERPYSIANAPQDHLLEFHIHCSSAESNFTHDLFQELLETKTIRLHGSFGHCVYHIPKQERWILLAGGTGLAPCKAIIEAAIADPHHTKNIELYWGVRTPEHLYEKKLLEQWQNTYSWFHWTPVIFNPELGDGDYRMGMVHDALIEDYPDLSDIFVYASGPAAMVLSAHQALLEYGLSPEQFCSDYT